MSKENENLNIMIEYKQNEIQEMVKTYEIESAKSKSTNLELFEQIVTINEKNAELTNQLKSKDKEIEELKQR